MINCDHCGKMFKFPSQLLRHLSSKSPCYSKSTSKKDKNEEIKKVEETLKQVEDKNECRKCGKQICNRYYLIKHEAKCSGLNSLQCPTCLKMFSSKSSKCHHIKKVNCKPPDTLPENICQPVNGGTINITNNINNDHSIHNDNRTLNNNHNHIYLVNFSDTDYSHVSIDQIIKMVSKCDASPSRFFNMMITEAHKNEYANVGLSNIKGNYATIYDEQQFLKVSAQEIVEEIGKKIVYRMDECRSDKENKDILKKGNIYRRVYSYSWLENVVDNTPPEHYDEKTSEALKTLNLRKRDAVDRINQNIMLGLHNVHNNMKEMQNKMKG